MRISSPVIPVPDDPAAVLDLAAEVADWGRERCNPRFELKQGLFLKAISLTVKCFPRNSIND